MRNYKCLKKNIFRLDNFHIEPIRDEDKYLIMEIRNEQLYHLRQAEPLTVEKQEKYFSSIVSNLFEEEKPSQLLFSFFENEEFIGYGGLVHINWIDRNAEISFVMKTALEKEYFGHYWSNYLKLIEQLGFEELKFHKIFTYAFDIRPHLYDVLLTNNFKEEARLKEHCKFEGRYLDVLIHSKINTIITFSTPTLNESKLYFDWANDPLVRGNSFSTNEISYETHCSWFASKLKDENCWMYLFSDHEANKIGQIRIQKDADFAVIGVSTDKNHRGKGYARKMIQQATDEFLQKNENVTIFAYIKAENTQSQSAFQKAGFVLKERLIYQETDSFLYIKKHQL